jgi:DNA-binding NarL/FixJ family response regulator
LEEQPGWEVAGEACDGREAVDKARTLKPDVTVVDVSMPGLNGLEATRQMLRQNAETKVLILTMHESDPLIREVLDAGARGYLLKSDATKDLVNAVEAIRRNKTYFTSRVAQMVLDGYLDKKPRASSETDVPATRLTPGSGDRAPLAEGKSSKEVAVALSLSVKRPKLTGQYREAAGCPQ